MIRRLRSSRKSLLRNLTLGMLILLLSNCEFFINSLEQPTSANAGDVITAKLDMNFQTEQGPYSKRIVVGVLAPRAWKLGQNQNVKITYTSENKGSGTLVPIPASVVAAKAKNGENWATRMKNRFGIGPNYIDDMEWVPFWTPANIETTPFENVHAVFSVQIKVGVDGANTSVKLGYVVCNDDDGIGDDDIKLSPVKYADCLEVKGEGDLIDFCNPSLTSLNPTKALDNDYQTISYNNVLIDTQLKGNHDLYLCATAHTSDGKSINVCAQNETSKLMETDPNQFQITFWPRKLFNVEAGQTITSMDYFITNKAGNIKVGYGNTDAPFTIKFACE
ncbi:DUF4961 domain-containing protein [Mucilaginibacter conchicola]|uniref:DUF4961 domain-containing protein n=1 Tax=Mucilaginibacter conchicola TaxID=2303333 RepID=A0A372NZ07_9SPHI|nr:DUF4961 domain-containing protein [Mucilaginibacter conchicola]RFZ94899.1 DUF4961 domain-containing protein [Mucilaginibacter conchicola]